MHNELENCNKDKHSFITKICPSCNLPFESLHSQNKKNGALDNYHSFNYHLYDGRLMINKEIITPYQEQEPSQYKNLLVI